jgi:hypothetical protein
MKTPSNLTVPAIIFLVMAMISSCKKNPVGPQVTPNVQLSADYVTCTEVWLKIGFADSPGGGDYRISRDGKTVLTGTFSGSSAILYDTTAQANKNYSYTAYRLSSGEVKQISPPLSLATLDSTSHNFTWHSFNFGGNAGSSSLEDVCIENDTVIYAVGDIPTRDSSNNSVIKLFDIVVWNGGRWSLGQILFPLCDPNGNIQSIDADPGYGILELSPGDIWASCDASLAHSVSGPFQPECMPIGYGQRGLRKMWGTAGQLYVVCTGGFVLHHTTYWESIATGTSMNFQDVWGTLDASSGQTEVLAVACNRFTDNGVNIVRISGNAANSIQTSGLPVTANSIWSANGKEWYVCGDVLSKTRSLNSPWQRVAGLPFVYQECIRGNGPNDIFLVGDFGLVSHFNGSTWYTFPGQIGNYVGLAVKGNLVVAVGYLSSGGVTGAATILMGRRN